MRMNRVLALLTALVLCLSAAPWALADTEYPPFQGIVADTAGVPSESTIADLGALSDRLAAETNGHIYVLTRHFLGGANAQEYAQKVFEAWNLTDQDALLLMVIGEESYALAAGSFVKSFLGAEKLNSLLATQFRTEYLSRAYDAAVAALAVELGRSMAKAAGETLNVAGLFGRVAYASTPQPQSWNDMWQSMFAQDDYDEGSGINWRGILIWGLVIYFLFFRRKKKRNRR